MNLCLVDITPDEVVSDECEISETGKPDQPSQPGRQFTSRGHGHGCGSNSNCFPGMARILNDNYCNKDPPVQIGSNQSSKDCVLKTCCNSHSF